MARTANHTYVDEFPPATGEYRERVIARMAQRQADIDYWKSVYATQQAAGIATTYSHETITKGDLIKYRSQWYEVVRANAKTVSVRLHERASWTNRIGYHEISGHRSADELPATPPEAV